jgi:hypothetical protein
MIATTVKCQKGPALLAKAGVTLVEAEWFYGQSRANTGTADTARLETIRRKVQSFLASNAAPARGRRAFA